MWNSTALPSGSIEGLMNSTRGGPGAVRRSSVVPPVALARYRPSASDTTIVSSGPHAPPR